MKVIDNLLSEEEFSYLRDYVVGSHISWSYKDDTSKTGDPFWHHTSTILHRNKGDLEGTMTMGMYPIEPLCRKLGIESTKDRIASPHGFIFDFPLVHQISVYAWPRIGGINRNTGESFAYDPGNRHPKRKTAFFYLNTNNGSTIFKRPGFQINEKVKCVANRVVIFNTEEEPFNQISCSNDKRSLIVKINYLENKDKDTANNEYLYNGAKDVLELVDV